MTELEQQPKSDAWIVGYAEAERRFMEDAEPNWTNPFHEGTDQHAGFEEGVYNLTQK